MQPFIRQLNEDVVSLLLQKYNRTKELAGSMAGDHDFHELLSSNPAVTREIIDCNPQIQWSHKNLSKNANIMPEYLLENPNGLWDLYDICDNPKISFDLLVSISREYPDAPMFDGSKTGDGQGVDISRFPIGENMICTFDQIRDYFSSYSQEEKGDIVRCVKMTLQQLHEEIDYPEKYDDALRNKHYTWEELMQIYELADHKSELSLNSSVTPEIVEANPHMHWIYRYLLTNPNFDAEFIENNEQHIDDLRGCVGNTNVTFKFKSTYSTPYGDVGWFYRGAIMSKDVTWEIVQSHTELLSRYYYFVSHPSSLEFGPCREALRKKYMKLFIRARGYVLPEIAEIISDYM